MGAKRFPAGKLSLFVALNLADLGLTWLLLQAGDGEFYESNPIANWWLRWYGWPGLAAFKAGAVLVVAGLAGVIYVHRPRTGGRVLTFASAVVALVVGYSTALAGWSCVRPEPADEDSLVAAARKESWIDQRRSLTWEYSDLLRELSADLAARRRPLADVVARLSTTAKANDPRWLGYLREAYPARTDAECLAANVIEHAINLRQADLAEAFALIDRLNAEFRALYGSDAPCLYPPLRPFLPVRGDG